MKRFILFLIFFIFFLILFFIFLNNSKKSIDVHFIDNLENNSPDKLKLCVKNINGNFVLIDIDKHKEEETYLYILKLYDNYRNHIPLNYFTPLKGNFEVLNLVRNKNEINIELKLLYLESSLNDFLNALLWSYQEFGITKLIVKVGNNYHTVNKNPNINLVFDSTSSTNISKQVIYYLEDGFILPIVYYHNDQRIDYLLKKLSSKYKINCSYELFDELFILYIDDIDNILTLETINIIIKNIKEISESLDIVVIINNDKVYNN